eukprot:COSAG01_NODE_19_length_39011_cov_38.134968_4_plen_160_part_00
MLKLVFPPSNHTLNDEARWMACSGAWDWAPYTATYNSAKAHTFTKGIWKSIYLVGVPEGGAALEHLQPRITYDGSYPSAPLSDQSAAGWTVVVRVHLVGPAAQQHAAVAAAAGGLAGRGTVTVSGSWGGTATKQVPALHSSERQRQCIRGRLTMGLINV